MCVQTPDLMSSRSYVKGKERKGMHFAGKELQSLAMRGKKLLT